MSNMLYYSDPYLKTCKSIIEETIEKDGRFHILLNETIFYPEGGGQPADTGFIDNIPVVDVYEAEDKIYHVLPSPPQNTIVECKLDFEKRFDHMQQHAGEHLLSSVFLSVLNGHNLGFHMGDDYVTIDISLEDISDADLNKVEDAANELIYRNLAIRTYFMNADDAAKLPLRKPTSLTGTIRVVEIDKLDYSACCGTHVGFTSEIGLIKILKTQKYKGMTRVYFKCGKRALKDFQNKHEMFSKLSNDLSTGEAQLFTKIKNDLQELKDKSRELKAVKEKLSSYEALEIVKTITSEPVVITSKDKSFEELEILARQILQLVSHILILSSLKDNKILACHTGDYNISLGKLFKESLPHFSGKGGGSDKQAQGLFCQQDELLGFEKLLKEQIESLLS